MLVPYCPKVKSASASAVESTCVCARYIIISTSVHFAYVFAAGRRRVIVRRPRGPRPNLSGPPPALNT